MKKVAIFVEGDTEFFFVEKLVQEVAGYGKVRLVMVKQHGNTIHFVKTNGAPGDVAQLEIYLVNCSCDGKVKPFIVERGERLKNKGYTSIIGLQDLYPKGLEHLEKFEQGLARGLEHVPIPVTICVAVKEIEAWFLNEVEHFKEIDPQLDRPTIANATGFDPGADDAEQTVNHPAGTLDKIYQLAGLRYKKHGNEIHRLIAALDFGSLYYDVRAKSTSLDKFLCLIDDALDVTPVAATVAA
ncbi:DUF4276 family protein [Paraburkholderia hospita]|uniref:DUF4276 family protein n=1 Tax=Paraburkholderia hospita TaxID=169430 RepID=UPI000B341B9E|nr:DUF4276 family protein [Paraburkholderia hospita]OUL74731.1 DUF4276 domain-containing protein [Paraburkholderia hospita]